MFKELCEGVFLQSNQGAQSPAPAPALDWEESATLIQFRERRDKNDMAGIEY